MVNASAASAASPVLVWSFALLALVVASGFVVGVYRSSVGSGESAMMARRRGGIAAVATAVWLLITLVLAWRGRLSFTSRQPTMMLLIVLSIALAVAIGVSRAGLRLATGIPLAALVGVQAFRFPLELLMHRAYLEGLMPVQMSYSGFNLDILTGLFALVVALVLVRNPSSLVAVRVWNTAGIVLLANILTIAVLSAPTPLRVFHNEPANVWIEHAPWVWLPAVFVAAAVLGHVTVYRRLRMEARVRRAGSAAVNSLAA